MNEKPTLPADAQSELDNAVQELKNRLGENLFSCILYGSAVRGDFVSGVSDLNLLLVLRESTPEAHKTVSDILKNKKLIAPFVLGARGFERSAQNFAVKFRSLRRHYRVLSGEDVLAKFEIDKTVLRFLCEQSLRNLRLRSVHAYIRYAENPKRYLHYLMNSDATIFTSLSEIPRLEGVELPSDFAERIPVLERYFAADTTALRSLLEFKEHPDRFEARDVDAVHSGLFRLLDRAVIWIESKWQKN